MKYRKTGTLILGIFICFLISVSMVNVHAAGNYQPLSVNIEISGKGTYVLESDASGYPMPEDSTLSVDGKGIWTIEYLEPGTYTYHVVNQKKSQEKKDITVFVINDENDATVMNASVIFEEDGKKTTGDFPVPHEEKGENTPESSPVPPEEHKQEMIPDNPEKEPENKNVPEKTKEETTKDTENHRSENAPDTGDHNNVRISFLVTMISLAAAGAALYRIRHMEG